MLLNRFAKPQQLVVTPCVPQGIKTPDIAAWQRFAQAPATFATTNVASEM